MNDPVRPQMTEAEANVLADVLASIGAKQRRLDAIAFTSTFRLGISSGIGFGMGVLVAEAYIAGLLGWPTTFLGLLQASTFLVGALLGLAYAHYERTRAKKAMWAVVEEEPKP